MTRGYAVESAAARLCTEAEARVSTNVIVRDPDSSVCLCMTAYIWPCF